MYINKSAFNIHSQDLQYHFSQVCALGKIIEILFFFLNDAYKIIKICFNYQIIPKKNELLVFKWVAIQIPRQILVKFMKTTEYLSDI